LVVRGVVAAFLLQHGLDLFQFELGEVLDADKVVARGFVRSDQFVELGLDRAGVAVLGILDQEHHQEGDDRRAGVDHQLPGIGIMEQRAVMPQMTMIVAARMNAGGRPAQLATLCATRSKNRSITVS